MAVTIKDVAKAAGTSISTVSKVINGHYSISEATAERVRAVMRELGYYPSASAPELCPGLHPRGGLPCGAQAEHRLREPAPL